MISRRMLIATSLLAVIPTPKSTRVFNTWPVAKTGSKFRFVIEMTGTLNNKPTNSRTMIQINSPHEFNDMKKCGIDLLNRHADHYGYDK